MKMTYTRVGDYYIPNLKVDQEERSIGKWGRMHREYLKEYHPIRFNQLVLSGKLWTHLADIQEEAQAKLELLVHQMASAEGATERMKERNPMEWVQRMNNIRSRAEEVVLSEIVYA